jgi:hypothetical protein
MTSVLMPYSNYDDAKSLISLYNIALNADDDIDFVEFVGEKLIASGIHFDDETCKHTNKIPPQSNLFYSNTQWRIIS